jgi:murein L,D-transpeptidase YcbB/YkuD
MRRRLPATLALLGGLALAAWRSLAGQAPPAPNPVDVLRLWLQPAAAARKLHAAGDTLASAADVVCFYDRRGFRPAWSDGGRLLPIATELVSTLEGASADGLRPEDYHLAALRRALPLLAGAPKADDVAGTVEADLLLTDAFLTYGAHLRSGRLHPETVYSDCQVTPPRGDLTLVLDTALEKGQVRQGLADLAPPHEGYRLLRAALPHLREVAARGGWATIPAGPKLKLGDRGPRVLALKVRLAEAPPPPSAPPATPQPDEFDAATAAALRTFQEHHGLDVDGAVGPATLRALNVSAAARAEQIVANLERWRWLPRDLGNLYIEVNIAGFGLQVVEGGKPALTMRVIVGKPYTRTPLFSSTMTHLILNPYWNVPSSILRKELAPKARRDPSYVVKEDFEVLRNGRSLPRESVDWSQVPGPGIAVRQRPGPKNALGRIKFVFPNRFDVYLHDTPSRSLFSKTVRSFSHGCMRIEKPLDLALFLLKDDPRWTPETLDAALEEAHDRKILLPRKVPVHVVYWTAWVDPDGTLELREDLYKRDEKLLAMLH